jgi:hypothetical protein
LQRRSTVVYATTEPGEALLLGGYTAVLDEGELLQYGPTAEVFHRPSLRVARAFSDPPMNLLAARPPRRPALRRRSRLPLPCAGGSRRPDRGRARQRAARAGPPGRCGLRGWWSWPRSRAPTPSCTCHALGELVAQLTGVHEFELGAPVTLHLTRPRPMCSPTAEAWRCPARAGRALTWHASNWIWRTLPAQPAAGQRLRAAAAEDGVRGRRRLRAAGPSGCGKTTMLNIMSGLLCPRRARCCSTAAT